MKDIRITENQMFLKADYAEIKEVKLKNDNVNEIRIYCLQYPDTFNFQIRTHKSITEWGKGKARNMIATVSLNIEELEQILKFTKEGNTKSVFLR